MSLYRLTPRAKDGLKRSLLHVKERFGREAAGKVRRAYLNAFRQIAENPSLGHRDSCGRTIW